MAEPVYLHSLDLMEAYRYVYVSSPLKGQWTTCISSTGSFYQSLEYK